MSNKKKKNIVDIVVGQGKKAQKIAKKQVGAFAGQVKGIAGDAADKAGDVKDDVERYLLKPVFIKNIKKNMPKIIRITDHDMIHENSPACKKSIGFKDIVRGKSILNIYTRYVDKTGITFYPVPGEGIYLADPFATDTYLAHEDYYSYLKKAKVAELTAIAEDLGAKHIKITWDEDESKHKHRAKKAKQTAKAKGQGKVSGSYDHNDESKMSKNEKILYESDFAGSSPTEPKLKYFALDSQIKNLIYGRLHQTNPLGHQLLILEQKNSLGIKATDAIAVDGAIKKYNIATVNASVSFKEETETEFKSVFIYEVDF